jgi:hypothetical protein
VQHLTKVARDDMRVFMTTNVTYIRVVPWHALKRMRTATGDRRWGKRHSENGSASDWIVELGYMEKRRRWKQL